MLYYKQMKRGRNKKRIKEIEKTLKNPPKEALNRLKKYKYCPSCKYVKDVDNCPKCGSKMRKIDNPYCKCKALLKIFIELEIITSAEVCDLRLTTLCWSYK